ncbi:energy-coupled thiamine transporter ThiT [Lacticaseibacillus salsurivasis]|uniref:energy-coupled thiamine transporter ThiT n=1 Tax=Lacticaseibacillus salsurivasis TaxID=3081441 RepID=UPI0030C6DCA3
MSKTMSRLIVLMEIAVIAAFAMALEYVPHKTGISSVEMSYGLIPISVLALRRGLGAGMAAGLTWGVLDVFLIGFSEGSVLNPLQGFLEYPIAFAVAGLGGLLYPQFQKALHENKPKTILATAWLAVLIGTAAKYFCHFLAGWVFWGSYAPKGMPAWLYSLAINGGSAIATGLVTLIVVTVLLRTVRKALFQPKSATQFQPQH